MRVKLKPERLDEIRDFVNKWIGGSKGTITEELLDYIDLLQKAVNAVIVTDGSGDRKCKLCGCYVDLHAHRPEACEIAMVTK